MMGGQGVQSGPQFLKGSRKEEGRRQAEQHRAGVIAGTVSAATGPVAQVMLRSSRWKA
jgi:hypothetical protein